MSDDTPLARAFAAGAMSVSVMKIGRRFVATAHAWREIEDREGAKHSEHVTVEGKGRTADDALRDVAARLRPTPAIEVREISRNRALGPSIVPAEVADQVTRIKGLQAPKPEPVALEATTEEPTGT